MRLMIILDWSRSSLEAIGGKFASGEDVAPERGEVVTRWHSPGSKKAWVVVDVPDAPAAQDWLSAWTDYVDVEMHPVLDDEEVGAVLTKRLPS